MKSLLLFAAVIVSLTSVAPAEANHRRTPVRSAFHGLADRQPVRSAIHAVRDRERKPLVNGVRAVGSKVLVVLTLGRRGGCRGG